MSTHDEKSQITFPWNGTLPSSPTVILRDIDVVGVGAKRRRQIEELQKARTIILQTHESQIPENVRTIYDQELLNTLQWLRPLKSEVGPALKLAEEHQVMFSRIFPLTEKYLASMAGRVRDGYLDEMEWSSWLLQDHWRYFVGFLRQRFSQGRQLSDLAHWEWVHAWLEVQPFELGLSQESEVLSLNPSLQIVFLSEDNAALGRTQGVYSFVFNPFRGVVERALDSADALLIDLLQEDRKYNDQQLIEMALLNTEIQPVLNREQWTEKVQLLKTAGIIL